MQIKGKNIILTGAGGGIGSEIAALLAKKGANLALVDMSQKALEKVMTICSGHGAKVVGIAADISKEEERARIFREASSALGPADVLVNNAGVMVFKSIKDHTEGEVYATLMVNVFAAIRLTQLALDGMIKRKSGKIVNIGSVFGSLAFPYFGVYSASKSAIKGFSEALRRELHGTGVGVTYVAPRAARTSQSPAFFEMAEKMKMNLDAPSKVAEVVIRAIEKDSHEVTIGLPERFFVFINKLFPSAVDKGLIKQAAIMAGYAPKA